ncbi:MAG: hypothetical protein FJ106_10935 [Deltaproteobacteria bacterium]|nr:hypothetical protein [Deltaproteobacteria bacterium]
MSGAMWIKYLNEGISFFLLVGIGIVLYRGLKKNQGYLSEREELLKRYLHFRGDIQVRLKVFGEDEQTYHELLKNLSESWKNFKKAYDEHLLSLSRNTVKVRRFLLLLAIGLLINSARLLIEEYFFFGLDPRFFYVAGKELSNYVLVIFGFFLLKSQTRQFLSSRGGAAKMERDMLFYSNSLSEFGEKEMLYNEFSPLEELGAGNGKKD